MKKQAGKVRGITLLVLLVVVANILIGIGETLLDKQPVVPDQPAISTRSISEQEQAIVTALEKSRQAFQRDQDNGLALKWINEAVDLLDAVPNAAAAIQYQVHFIKGEIHWRVWHYADAEISWQQAYQYANQKQRQQLRWWLDSAHKIVENYGKERKPHADYHASPNVGPASKLQGHTVIIYVFIEDGGAGRWGLRDRNIALNAWQSAQTWLQQAVAMYQQDIYFSKRVFVLKRHPRISRMQVNSFNKGYKNADKIAKLAAQHFGHSDVLSFTDHVKREAGADNAVLLFHLARQDRSFAMRCMRKCSLAGEFMYVMESTNFKSWQSLEYAQAHETLHLFGADDLYAIGDARYHATRDIMNYPSKVLRMNTLEPITAYAVGLLDKKPNTPFDIVTHN